MRTLIELERLGKDKWRFRQPAKLLPSGDRALAEVAELTSATIAMNAYG